MESKMNLAKFKTFGYAGAAVILLSLTSCNTMTNSHSNNSTTEFNDDHNAKNSLDYDGIYLGTIPCADCPGIKTTLYINRDNTYVMTQEYLEKSTDKIEEKGTYSWDKSGSKITLKPSNGNGKSQMFFVGEGTMTMLDQSGNKITGALADLYILSKDNVALLNKKWNIMEMYGERFNAENTMKKEGYIQFDGNSNRFSASAGCNQMNGSFNLKANNQLELGHAMSTMMACNDMSVEQKLGKVLEETKSFQVGIDELILLNKDKKVIAKFKTPMY